MSGNDPALATLSFEVPHWGASSSPARAGGPRRQPDATPGFAGWRPAATGQKSAPLFPATAASVLRHFAWRGFQRPVIFLLTMAWRIHDSVVRGELDNRERGVVRGRLWLHGNAEPVVLELRGNAWPDLAGCLLTFENPGTTFPMPPDACFNPRQQGTVGDLTASRKVRVLELPIKKAYLRKKQGLPVPEHMANCLYLEWFSEANGRVVVESHEYRLNISPPAWQLTPDEEHQRQKLAAEGFAGFMQKVSDALEAARHKPPEDKEWDEFDYEQFLRENDARTDKYMELLDKYGDSPAAEKRIAKEMGWEWLEEALEEREGSRRDEADTSHLTVEQLKEHEGRDEDEDDPFALEVPDDLELPEPDPATEGVDWVRDKDGYYKHPLSLRAFESCMALWHKCDQLGLKKSHDNDLCTLIGEFQITGAKLAGALNSLVYGRDHREGAFIVAYLKRALSHLHAAQNALEKVAPRRLLPAETLDFTRKELFAIREEILRLMDEFRRAR